MYVNSPQKLFTYLGYYGNSFSRMSVRQIEHLTRPNQKVEGLRIAALFFSVSLAFVFALPAFSCYAIAACLGKGRFEQIKKETSGEFWNKREIKVMSLNACFQDPWAPFTGGVVAPFEPVPDFQTRIDAVVNAIASQDPDLFLGQEFDSIGAQNEAVRLLSQRGFCYFLRDLGSSDPFRNHSGLFVASKIPLNRVEFHPYRLEDRSGLAKMASQGALTFTTDVGGKEIRWVNVHLNYGDALEDQNARNRQLSRYAIPLLKESSSILLGDLNFDTSKVDRAVSGLLGLVNSFEGETTCANLEKRQLRGAREVWEDSIDGLIYDPSRIQVLARRVLPLPRLSDHFAITAICV